MALSRPSYSCCFVSGGKANLRLIDTAAECHQLNVAGTQMTEPVIYVAIEGAAGRIAPLARWARTPSEDTSVTYDITKTIPYGGQPWSPACS